MKNILKISFLIITILFIFSCQNEDDTGLSKKSPINSNKQNTPLEKRQQRDCFETAAHFFELSSNYLGEFPPFSAESIEGTLDMGADCYIDSQKLCQFSRIENFEVLSFNILASGSGDFYIDECDLYCGPSTLSFDSAQQEDILDKAIIIAKQNAPICPETGNKKKVVGIDFSTTFTVGAIRASYFLTMAVKYASCIAESHNPDLSR
jgi:hypothetical protein